MVVGSATEHVEGGRGVTLWWPDRPQDHSVQGTSVNGTDVG